MKKRIINRENAILFSMFDEGHQKMLESLQEVTSVWFMNVLMKTLIRHKCRTKESEKLTEEEIQLLTHADRTLILEYLMFYCISKKDPKAENALKKVCGDLKEGFGDVQVDSLLLVLYNLLDIQLAEFQPNWLGIMGCNSKMCN